MAPETCSALPVRRELPPLAPPACIGVLGGGQLARMLVQAAQSMGYRAAVLDPDPACPASAMAEHFLCFDYTDEKGLQALSELCERVTTEFENVPAQTLDHLARTLGASPKANSVRVAQNRVREKTTIRACDLPVAPFHVIETQDDLAKAPLEIFPAILKTAQLGYDGKGQVVVPRAQDLAAAYAQLQSSQKTQDLVCVLEKKLPLLAECSVVLARSDTGVCVHLPIQINQHLQGILFSSTVFPGWVHPELERELLAAAQTLAKHLDYVGVLCVEFFLLDTAASGAESTPGLALEPDPSLWVVNEIAPRPHNSGHHSLNSCAQSQFELQLRVLMGLPLTPVAQHSPCVMLNLLGDLWWDASPVRPQDSAFANDPLQPQEPDWSRLLALPGTHLHLYGKKEARRCRKMGHLNITGSSPEAVKDTVDQCLYLLGLGGSGLGVSPRLVQQGDIWALQALPEP
jgi:5-(carboxyamino)imidazole ribonucleotide synthase